MISNSSHWCGGGPGVTFKLQPHLRNTGMACKIASWAAVLLAVVLPSYAWHISTAFPGSAPPVSFRTGFSAAVQGLPRRRGFQRKTVQHSLLMSTTEQQPQLWEELVDDDTGSTYYWNKMTGETQWEKPAALDLPADGDRPEFSNTDDYAEIEECAKFFVKSFWMQGTTLGNLDLTGKQQSAILEEQKRDLGNRYGRLLGERKLKSSLIISRDDGGNINGCVGVEIAVANKQSCSVLSRDAGEQLLNSGLASLGGRQRGLIRKAPLTELASAVLAPDMGLIPVLSNLAVSPAERGRGLGRSLCAAAEAAARGWGFGEMLLLVEAGNAPAQALYTSLGYQVVKTADVKTVRIGTAEIESEMVQTLTMAKQLL